jgi:hypothetical protein
VSASTDNRYSMLELAQSRPSGLQDLIEKYGSTTSHEIAGALLGALKQLRREGPVPVSEVNSAIFGLLKTLRVWVIAPWTPEGMLNTLREVIYEDGVPRDADRGALAELIERAADQQGPALEGLNISTIEVCSSLVNRDELVSVLALRPGAREAVMQHIETIKRRLSAAGKDLFGLYEDEIEYVLKALQTDSKKDEPQ